MCDHQEKDHKRGKTANSKSQPTKNHHQNQGRHQHHYQKKSHQSDDTYSQDHSSAEDSIFSDHHPDHRRPSVNDQTHHPPSHHNHHKQNHHRVSLTEASLSSSTSSSSHSSSSSSSSTSSSPSSFSSSSLSSSSSASSSSLSSDTSSERLDRHPARKPQHSQSCTDISGKSRYFEEGDDTAPLIEGRGDQNRQSARQKREKGKSSRNRPTHSKRQKIVRGSGNDGSFRKSKSMEALTGRKDSEGHGNLDEIEQETSKGEAKKNLMKEKKKFSAFLNEITRQVLSPMRLTTLGVTDAQRACSPRQGSSARASKIDSRTEKRRQHRTRPTSADSVTSSRHSHTSQHSTRLSNSKSFPHDHTYDSADSSNHMYHRPRSCTDISCLKKPHTQTPQHHNRSSSYKGRHRHQGDHTSSHHDHHYEECKSPSPQHHHGDQHNTSHHHYHGHRRDHHRHGDHHSPTHHHGEHHNTFQHHRGHPSPSHHRHYGDHHHGDCYSPTHHHGQHHSATHHHHRHGDHQGPARHYHHGEDHGHGPHHHHGDHHGHAPHHEDNHNTTHHYHHGDPPNTSHHHEGRHTPTHDHGDHNSGHHPHSNHPDTERPTTPHQHRHHSLSSIEHRDHHSPKHQHHHGDDHSPPHQHHHGDDHSPPHHHHHGDHHSPPHHHHHGDDHSAGHHHGDHHSEGHQHHHGDDHSPPHHQHHGHDQSPPHHHHHGDHHSEGHHHGDHHNSSHQHHHGNQHSSGHQHHRGDHHSPGHQNQLGELQSPAHQHHHGDHHSESHQQQHEDHLVELLQHPHGDHHSPGHQHHHGDHHGGSHPHHHEDHHTESHQNHHGDHHTESHQNHQGDHHSTGHKHHHGDHHADTHQHHQGHPPESHLNQSYSKNNDHDHDGHDDHHTHLKGHSADSPPSHRKPESLITKADPAKNTLSPVSLEEERTSFTDSSAHKEEAHELGRIMVLQEKNEGLHHNLLKTAVRMECLGEEFVNSQKILEAELQTTRMELSSLTDRFRRLHDSCSSTQQTNNLLQLKLNSVAQNMEGERERLNQRISALTVQLADAKFGNSVETFKATSVHHKTNIHFQSGDAINPVVLPIAPPPAQFMDTHTYGNTNAGGQDQLLGSVPEEEESDWSEFGEEIPRFILTGSNRNHAWRHQEADVDKDSESGGEETIGLRSAQLRQTSHLQFNIHNEILPAPQSNACPSGFKNLSDSMTAEGNYRITSSPNIGSSILIRSASLEEIPLARHHMQKELRGTEAMMDLHHPREDVIGDLDNEIIHHWRTNSDREAAMGMLAESRMSDVNSGLASLQTAEQMLNHFIRESQASEGKGQGRAEVHGWMGGIPDEVLKGERTKL
ncbi:repetin isoform X2 [Hippoglossus stenolepis]|uniref:repetin isoform X2 n=1 Tax=Hippoglossus stenolepis TaxID=195615 RepID=UPI001FAE867A|nr:repetin isoform X2 [Hippoglossus stenolepis]